MSHLGTAVWSHHVIEKQLLLRSGWRLSCKATFPLWCQDRAEAYTIACLTSTFNSLQPLLPQILRELPWNEGKAWNDCRTQDVCRSPHPLPPTPAVPWKMETKSSGKNGEKDCISGGGGLGAPWGLSVLPKVGNNTSCAGGSVFLRRAKLRDGDFLNLSWKRQPRSARGQRLVRAGSQLFLPCCLTAGACSWWLTGGVEEVSSLPFEGWEGWAAVWGLVKGMWDSAPGWFPC